MTGQGVPPRRVLRLTSTIRFRVTALATLAVLAVLCGAAVALVAVQERLLTDNLDDTLARRADDVAAVLAGDATPALASGTEESGIQVVDAQGSVVASTENLEGAAPIAAPPPDGTTETIRTAGGLPIDDDRFRVLSRRVEGTEPALVVHVAATYDDVAESVGALTRSLTVAVPVVAALLAALVWWLAGRTLRPVEAIRAEVAGITGGALDRRVPEPPGGDEVARLARTMNEMLERVEHATERQRRFVADASHELRSPLTRIRSELEVDLAHPAGSDPAATHRSVLEEVTSLERLVDDLLHLARSDAGAWRRRDEAVDLDVVVLTQARRLRDLSDVRIDTSAVSAAAVRGDAGQLARAVGNLADNAARHASGRVSFSVSTLDGEVVLAVTDDGSGIPPAEHERIFERFTRLDDSRTRGTGGAGLGLAIARDIVERHGGTLTIDPQHAPGARFVVTLPTPPE